VSLTGVDATFAALADPTRRRVLGLLAERPEGATASELSRELPVTRQAIAKHLAALDAAGLATPVRRGRDVRYTVSPAPLEDAVAWMTRVGDQWDMRLARLARHAGSRVRA
jgi:DNA-binding transcriptional ArsR family regulator